MGVENPDVQVRLAVNHYPFVVGWHPDCDRRLGLPFISRHHCRVFLRDGTVWVEDLASRNATFLNGEPANEPRPVGDGDRLALGELLLDVSLSEEPADWRAGASGTASEVGPSFPVADDTPPSAREARIHATAA